MTRHEALEAIGEIVAIHPSFAVSDARVEAFCRKFQRYHLDEVLRAIDAHLRGPNGRYAPTFNELMGLVAMERRRLANMSLSGQSDVVLEVSDQQRQLNLESFRKQLVQYGVFHRVDAAAAGYSEETEA